MPRKGVIRKITGDESPPAITKTALHQRIVDSSSHKTTRKSKRLAHQNEYNAIPNTSGSDGIRRVARQTNTPPFSHVGETAIATQTPPINNQVSTALIRGRNKLLTVNDSPTITLGRMIR
jgi:hypothetical protein